MSVGLVEIMQVNCNPNLSDWAQVGNSYSLFFQIEEYYSFEILQLLTRVEIFPTLSTTDFFVD
jgi:hypothetical protein